MHNCTRACVSIASGRPFRPSTHAMKQSSMPRACNSPKLFRHEYGPLPSERAKHLFLSFNIYRQRHV